MVKEVMSVRVKLMGCDVPINVTRDEFRLLLKRVPKKDIVVVKGSLNGSGRNRDRGNGEIEREESDAGLSGHHDG